MIIFGTSKEYVRHTEKLGSSQCPHCSNYNTISAEVLMRYAHIWYIPFFPVGKRVIASCSHCKAAYDSRDLSQNLSTKCDEIKSNVKYPLKYWAWMLVIVGAILLVIILPLFAKLFV